jgi:hypothetical protein
MEELGGEQIMRDDDKSRRESQEEAAAAGADGILQSVRLEYDLGQLDSDVLSALHRWRDVDTSRVADLQEVFQHSSVAAQAGFEHALEGFTAEELAAQYFHAELPGQTNVEDVDFSLRGIDYQVKFGSSSANQIRESLTSRPDVSIVTGPEAAQKFASENVIGLPELDTDTIRGTVNNVGAALSDFDEIPVPFVSAITTAMRETRNVIAGRSTPEAAIAHATLHLGSRVLALQAMAYVITLVPGPQALVTIPLMLVASMFGARIGRGAVRTGIPARVVESLRRSLEPRPLTRERVSDALAHYRFDTEVRDAAIACIRALSNEDGLVSEYELARLLGAEEGKIRRRRFDMWLYERSRRPDLQKLRRAQAAQAQRLNLLR